MTALVNRRVLGLVLVLMWIWPSFAFAGRPVVVEEGAMPLYPQQPQLAVDEQGTIHVAYGRGNTVRYRRSTDGGKSFGSAVELPMKSEISLGMRRGPRITAFQKTICITVIGGSLGKGQDGDVLAFRSLDGGKSWSGPVMVNDVADAAREGLHGMALGPGGELCCVWLDLRNTGTEVMASVSTNGGESWSRNSRVYRSPGGSVCECCHPSVAIDERGRIHVLWRNSWKGQRDMYVSMSTDGGKSFGAASKLGTGAWPLKACPMDGGAIAVSGNRVATTWRRGHEVFLADGQPSEQKLGEGEQPWIAATEDGPIVVWLTKRGESLMLKKPRNKEPIQLARQAADPVIAAGPGGKGPVVVAWEVRDGEHRRIECQVLQD